ncbi:MAG: hypothetical protein AB7O47_12015 [Flavobacteriales bacterium]
MAKDKKTIYVMLPIILLVWAFVFYQLYGYFFAQPHYSVKELAVSVAYDKIVEDSFTIVANYRDPFLGSKTATSISSENSTQPNKTSNSTAAQNKQPWPMIEYKGMIKNNNSNKRIGIVVINGSEHIIKQGEVMSDVTVVKIDKTEIKVRYQNEHKIISK